MKILALLNRDGGSLKTTDLGQLTTLMQDEFRMHGHELTVDDCSGDEIVAAIGKAAEREDIDVLLVGGGDGTTVALGERQLHRRALLKAFIDVSAPYMSISTRRCISPASVAGRSMCGDRTDISKQ